MEFLAFIFWIIGLFILYIVIRTAVKDGINMSIIGQFIEEKYEFKGNDKSSSNNDLDS